MNEEHLKLIQAVISRMAGNSFLLKGWAVTIVSALLALGSNTRSVALCLVALAPSLLFAGLDGYYLYQERLFRELYNAVLSRQAVVPFSMDTAFARAHVRYFRSLFSVTILSFYLGLIVTVGLAALLVAVLPPMTGTGRN